MRGDGYVEKELCRCQGPTDQEVVVLVLANYTYFSLKLSRV